MFVRIDGKGVIKMKKLFVSLLLASSILVGCQGEEQVMAEPEIKVGYIYMKENQLLFDEVEIIGRENEKKIEELQLVEERDYPSGYYIYNEVQEIDSFVLTKETTYIFTDIEQKYVEQTAEDKVYETNNFMEFMEASAYQNLNLEDINLNQQYIPYFVEVLDGKVISIEEDFMYTI